MSELSLLSGDGGSWTLMLSDSFWRRVQPIDCDTFCELLAGVLEQGLSRPFIELPCDITELGLAMQGQMGGHAGRYWRSNLFGVFV